MRSYSYALIVSALAFAACGNETTREAPPRSAANSPPQRMPEVAPAPDVVAYDGAANTSAPVVGSEFATPAPETTESKIPDVIYVPTPQPVVDKMLALAKVKK